MNFALYGIHLVAIKGVINPQSVIFEEFIIKSQSGFVFAYIRDSLAGALPILFFYFRIGVGEVCSWILLLRIW